MRAIRSSADDMRAVQVRVPKRRIYTDKNDIKMISVLNANHKLDK